MVLGSLLSTEGWFGGRRNEHTYEQRERARERGGVGGGQWNCADSCSRVSFTVMLAYFSHVFAIFHNSLVSPFMCFSMFVCVCVLYVAYHISVHGFHILLLHEYYEK